MSGETSSKHAAPAPIQPPGRSGGTGQGSGSALDAMLKKRREGENCAADDVPTLEEVKSTSATPYPVAPTGASLSDG